MQTETLIEKIKNLPPERISEVEDFVDFIAQRNAAASRHEASAAYAAERAGSDVDLDSELEAATHPTEEKLSITELIKSFSAGRDCNTSAAADEYLRRERASWDH